MPKKITRPRIQEDEIKKIEKLIDSGKTTGEIAEISGRSCATVVRIRQAMPGYKPQRKQRNTTSTTITRKHLTGQEIADIRNSYLEGFNTEEVMELTDRPKSTVGKQISIVNKALKAKKITRDHRYVPMSSNPKRVRAILEGAEAVASPSNTSTKTIKKLEKKIEEQYGDEIDQAVKNVIDRRVSKVISQL